MKNHFSKTWSQEATQKVKDDIYLTFVQMPVFLYCCFRVQFTASDILYLSDPYNSIQSWWVATDDAVKYALIVTFTVMLAYEVILALMIRKMNPELADRMDKQVKYDRETKAHYARQHRYWGLLSVWMSKKVFRDFRRTDATKVTCHRCGSTITAEPVIETSYDANSHKMTDRFDYSRANIGCKCGYIHAMGSYKCKNRINPKIWADECLALAEQRAWGISCGI